MLNSEGIMGRGRPGGNPDFGTKFKANLQGKQPKTELLTIRLTPEEMEELKKIPKFRDACRDAILNLIGQLSSTAPTTKTETTEPVTADQPQQHNQTNQEDQPEETDPNQPEQEATPKTRHKERQNQEQNQAKPRTRSQNRKSSETEN